MSVRRALRRNLAVLAALLLWASSAYATTLIRAGLDELVAGNQTILVAEAMDTESYWNSDGTFILTDVIVKPIETLKGEARDELTITLMGGSVGDLTTLIVGGAQLIPGRSYVLFLNEEELPGTPGAMTVRDHAQGVFDIEPQQAGELHAVSQANGHPLVPDRQGYLNAPGGVDGFPLEVLVSDLRDRIEEATRKEVTQ